MASIFVKLRIMPEEADMDMDKLTSDCEAALTELGVNVVEKTLEPIAFGLKALMLTVVGIEADGSEPMEKAVAKVEGVSEVDAVDIRRAVG